MAAEDGGVRAVGQPRGERRHRRRRHADHHRRRAGRGPDPRHAHVHGDGLCERSVLRNVFEHGRDHAGFGLHPTVYVRARERLLGRSSLYRGVPHGARGGERTRVERRLPAARRRSGGSHQGACARARAGACRPAEVRCAEGARREARRLRGREGRRAVATGRCEAPARRCRRDDRRKRAGAGRRPGGLRQRRVRAGEPACECSGAAGRCRTADSRRAGAARRAAPAVG